ncbi:AraC family transcriptional regulator [Methylomonas sp. SURF-2]|uniref:AraC family transcriptional regulator n=1 Tax=Methylomonas subterranea TaxID=2952225 RepID=A0ABT1TLL1_9GAMM|nr:AraC family transcriptional regulator [Methylomonas sp. SURF-2]MCQ8106325.1 AraC family transcriptional regulator [Methylomonas sp. SURF-2]
MPKNSCSPWRIKQTDIPWQTSPDADAQLQTLPESLGRCQSRIYRLDADLSYIETHYQPTRNLAMESRMPPQAPRMVLTLGLRGHSSFHGRQDDTIDFKAGQSTITTFNASEGSRQYQANHAVSQLRFSMTQAWLEHYFGEGAFADCFKADSVRVVSQRASAAGSLLAARAMLQNSLPAQAQALFSLGQAMAIVATELGDLLNAGTSASTRMPAADKRLAEKARDILATEFKNPPSIMELSKRVGTNPFKLKQVFHRHLDTTPYGLLLSIRMEQAYRLLATQHYPVGLAAEAVGYQHASNFSAAFNRHFGFPPKQLCRAARSGSQQ